MSKFSWEIVLIMSYWLRLKTVQMKKKIQNQIQNQNQNQNQSGLTRKNCRFRKWCYSSRCCLLSCLLFGRRCCCCCLHFKLNIFLDDFSSQSHRSLFDVYMQKIFALLLNFSKFWVFSVSLYASFALLHETSSWMTDLSCCLTNLSFFVCWSKTLSWSKASSSDFYSKLLISR